ncbi:Os09g0462000, partial [Oryza sativa Japonica Group]
LQVCDQSDTHAVVLLLLLVAQVAGDEGQLLGGLGARGLVEEVDVHLAGGLVLLHLAAPPAVAERRRVRLPALLEVVEVGHRHGHARARQLPPLRRRHGQRVHQRVVDAVLAVADERPRRLVLAPPRRVRGLRAHGVLAPEVGVEEEDAGDGHAALKLPPVLPGAHRHVVRDVGAGAVAGEEQAGHVPAVPQPRLRPGPAVLGHPVQRLPRVVVRRRHRVLRREAVVHGHRHDARLRRDLVQVVVVLGRERRLDDERAAVEEHKNGQRAGKVLLPRTFRRR